MQSIRAGTLRPLAALLLAAFAITFAACGSDSGSASAQGPEPADTPVQVPSDSSAPDDSGDGVMPLGERAVTDYIDSVLKIPKKVPPTKLDEKTEYRVESGDSLVSIARKTGVRTAEIRKANNLKTDFLRVGQILTIPGAGNQKVASATPKNVDPVVTGTAGPSKEQKPAPAAAKDESHPVGYTPPQKTDKVIAETEQKEAAIAPETTGIGKMRWPVRGRIITPFGGSGGAASDGIDIAVPEGTPVKAAENGVVIYAGNGLKDFGNTVLIRHDDGLVTVYGHNGKLEVTRGEKVRRGQEIALSGMSGTTPSPRLHFEVRKNSAPVNPTKYLE